MRNNVLVDVYVYNIIHVWVPGRHCSVDEETHGVFGSCRRGRGATVEATCQRERERRASETAEQRGDLSRSDNELGATRE